MSPAAATAFDNRRRIRLKQKILLTKGRLPEAYREVEQVRCPRADLQFAPGRLGYQPPGTMTGMGGASLDWDTRRRVTPVQTASQEAWPEADLGDEILSEMRAAVERRQACALRRARAVRKHGGCDLRLSAFCLPFLDEGRKKQAASGG